MVEDVINSLENMKLTTDKEEVIVISEEGRKEEIKSCAKSLIENFLTCKPFNKRTAQNILRKSWRINEGWQIVEAGLNLFQFKFNTEFDMKQVIREGPWTFDNQALMLHCW